MKLLYFDLEHGSKTLGSKDDIKNLFGYPMLEPGSWKEFIAIIKQLYTTHKIKEDVKIGNITVSQEKTEIKPASNTEISGIIIDTVSELSKKYQRSLTLEDGTMKLKEWGKLKNNLDKMLDMLTKIPGILIMNCHSKTQHMDDGTTRLIPYIDGSTKEDISKWFDFVFYTKTSTDLKGNSSFLWRTQRTERYDNAKDRTQLLDAEIPQDYRAVIDVVKKKGWKGAKILVIGSPGSGKTLSLNTIRKGNK